MRHRPSMSPNTILTGAAGWFGKTYLARAADDIHREAIRVLVEDPAQVDDVLDVNSKVDVHTGDIVDTEVVAKLLDGAEGACVIHAAGVIHPTKWSDFDRVNVRGTETLLSAARAAGVRRLVYLSSNSPFGVNPTRVDVFRHDEPYNPHLGYGASKMRAELAVLEANGVDGLETVVLRPPWFYGEWQPARQTKFLTLCRLGRLPIMGNGEARRSMVYVGDLVHCATLAQTHPVAPGRAYWVADAEPYTVNEIVETVRRVLREEGYRVSPRQLRVPGVVGTVAARIDRELQSRHRYNTQVHVLGELGTTIACDISRTTSELGYRPSVGLEHGMHKAIRWCREHDIEL